MLHIFDSLVWASQIVSSVSCHGFFAYYIIFKEIRYVGYGYLFPLPNNSPSTYPFSNFSAKHWKSLNSECCKVSSSSPSIRSAMKMLPSLLSSTWASRWTVGTSKANWDLPFRHDHFIPTLWGHFGIPRNCVSYLEVRCGRYERFHPTCIKMRISIWELIGATYYKNISITYGCKGHSGTINGLQLWTGYLMVVII